MGGSRPRMPANALRPSGGSLPGFSLSPTFQTNAIMKISDCPDRRVIDGARRRAIQPRPGPCRTYRHHRNQKPKPWSPTGDIDPTRQCEAIMARDGRRSGQDPLNWIVYILRCADGTLYTGITNDLERRMAEHEAGQGAKYTKGRGPFKLVYQETCRDRGLASKREIEIKSLDRKAKLLLVSTI